MAKLHLADITNEPDSQPAHEPLEMSPLSSHETIHTAVSFTQSATALTLSTWLKVIRMHTIQRITIQRITSFLKVSSCSLVMSADAVSLEEEEEEEDALCKARSIGPFIMSLLAGPRLCSFLRWVWIWSVEYGFKSHVFLLHSKQWKYGTPEEHSINAGPCFQNHPGRDLLLAKEDSRMKVLPRRVILSVSSGTSSKRDERELRALLGIATLKEELRDDSTLSSPAASCIAKS